MNCLFYRLVVNTSPKLYRLEGVLLVLMFIKKSWYDVVALYVGAEP